MKTLRIKGLGVAVTAMLIAASSANAVVYSFVQITQNGGADVTSQLGVDVTDAGVGKVSFRFFNTGPLASSITDVYFDDGSLLGIASIMNGSSGVNFSQGASPGNLPSGNSIDFNTTAGFAADSNPPTQPNGVNPGEELTIVFNLINSKTFADTIDALELSLANPGVDMTGGLRIGIHVQGYANGESESFVTCCGNNVPDASSTMMLLGMGLAGIGFATRRFTRA